MEVGYAYGAKGILRQYNPVQNTPKLHVWGAFSARGTFPLKVFKENLTGQLYIDILNGCLVTQPTFSTQIVGSSKKTAIPGTLQRLPRNSSEIIV